MKTKAELRSEVRKFQRWRKKRLAEDGTDSFDVMTAKPAYDRDGPMWTDATERRMAQALDSGRPRGAPGAKKTGLAIRAGL